MADVAEQVAPVAASGAGGETIRLVSRRFGTFDVPTDSVLHFAQGLIGFPAARRFVILDHRPGSPFKWMLSLDDPELGFAIANPVELVVGYEPPLAVAARVLEVADDEVADDEVALFVIVTIPSDPKATTVNLLAPVVVDMRMRRARQVVLESSKVNPRHPVMPAAAEPATES